jgi:hypothetical protein
VVFRGDPATFEFVALWVRDGVVAAAMNANVWDLSDGIEALLAARRPVDLEAVADPDTDLASLAVRAGDTEAADRP